MEENPKPSTWQRSTTRRFLCWLFSRRTLRRGAIALAWLVSLGALYYGITDWRSGHAWNEYRQDYEAHVGSLDLQAYIPKPIPEAENFAATPFAAEWILKDNDTNFLFARDAWSRADNMIPNPPKTPRGKHYEQHFEDMVAWQEAFAVVRAHPGLRQNKEEFQTDKLDLASRAQAAPAVLDGLKDDEAAFEELRAASARPEARYPVVYDLENPWGILLPHLAKVKGTCLRLKLKACAELAVGQNEKALDDVKLSLYLADTLRNEPFLISYLVRLSCVHIAVAPIWEGLAEHHWTEPQLERLQALLAPYDFLADMQRPTHAERAAGVLTVDLVKKNGLGWLGDLAGSDVGPKPLLNILGRIAPSSWYDQEKLHYCQHFDGLFRGTLDEAARRVFPSQITANNSELEDLNKGPWNILIHHKIVAKSLLPAVGRVATKAAMAQTATDQAAIACALERYHLANGQFPESLPALTPRFAARLANDVFTGEPLKYRRLDYGRFVLYSVGWNQKDDGGAAGSTMYDEKEGDWVWEYPASSGK